MAFSMVIIDSGFSQALIRDQNVNQRDYSSVFYFNIFVGLCVYLIAYFSAPYISLFYNEPLLTPLIRVTFISMVCLSFSVVQQARLFKEVNFATVSKISLISAIISGICGIYTAYLFRNAWALIVQSVSSACIRTCLFWFYGKWYPSLIFSLQSIKKYLIFSMNLLGTNMIASITDNLPNLLIGKYFNASALAYYTIPEKIQRSIAGTISFSIHRVSYPIMVSFQNEQQQLLEYSKKVVGMAFFIIAPLMLILAILSKPLILILLSEDWIEVATYLKYLAIYGALYCFADINLDILIVRGKTKKVFQIEIVRKIVFLICLIIGITATINVLLIMLVVYQLFNALFVSYFAEKEIGGNLLILFHATIPTLCCLIPAGIVCSLITLLNLPNVLCVLLASCSLIGIYLLVAKLSNNCYFNFSYNNFKNIMSKS